MMIEARELSGQIKMKMETGYNFLCGLSPFF